MTRQLVLSDLNDEISVDLFAGGGGASLGYKMATGRDVDIAVNHDARAVSMHEVNHPQTTHYCSDVFEIDPRFVVAGRKVGLLWASPDCTDHSKAKGSAPLRSSSHRRRALAWVVKWWAAVVKPRCIMLENVEEFVKWGPLVGKPDALQACKKRRGKRFKQFIRALRNEGYTVEWRELRACEYGAPTIRKRLILCARRDGRPIVWPTPTHADPKSKTFKTSGLKPWRSAASCIDWTVPMFSIFGTKEEARVWAKFHKVGTPQRPLKPKSMGRIARGVERFVLKNPRPFFVPLTHTGGQRVRDGQEPLATVTGANRGEQAIAVPVLSDAAHGEGNGQRKRRGFGSKSIQEPVGTLTGSNEFAVTAPVFVQANYGEKPFSGPEDPLHTIVAGGTHHSVVAPLFTHANTGYAPNSAADDPLHTIVSDGARHSVIAPVMVPRYGEREGQEPRSRSMEEPYATVVPTGNGGYVAAAQISTYYGGRGGEERGQELTEPLRTQGTENRFGLSALMVQNNGGFYEGAGRQLDEPLSTILCESRGHQGLVGVHVDRDFGASNGNSVEEPLGTVCGSGGHARIIGSAIDGVRDRSHQVAAFLAQYNSTAVGQSPASPINTVSSHDRFGLIYVTYKRRKCLVLDILMRMLTPRELFRCQGFPDSYIIEHDAQGRKFTKSEQVHMCGNSVPPQFVYAMVRANLPEMALGVAA